MRRRLARTLVLSLSLLSWSLAPGARAGGPARGGEHWDDRHMQSNFAHRRGPAPPRPAVQGTDRYHQATEAPAPTPPTGVAETTLQISPHEWTPGGASSGAHTSGSLWSRDGVGSRIAGARPTTRSGVRTSAGVRLNSTNTRRNRR